MQGLQVFIRTVDALNEWLGRLIAWLTLGCVLATFGVAVMRYQFSIGRPWAEELYVWLHAFVFMAGAGYTFVHHGHVRVDIFYGSMSLRRRAWIDLLGTLFFLMPWLAVITYYCWPFVADKGLAFGVAQARAGTRRDEHADATLDDDQSFVLEALIGLGDSQRIGAFLRGQGADRRQRVTVAEAAGQDGVGDHLAETDINGLFVGRA